MDKLQRARRLVLTGGVLALLAVVAVAGGHTLYGRLQTTSAIEQAERKFLQEDDLDGAVEILVGIDDPRAEEIRRLARERRRLTESGRMVLREPDRRRAVEAAEIGEWALHTPGELSRYRPALRNLARWQVALDRQCASTDNVTRGASTGLFFVSCLNPSGRIQDAKNVYYTEAQILELHRRIESGDVPPLAAFPPAKVLGGRR